MEHTAVVRDDTSWNIAATICQAAQRGETSTITSLLKDHPIDPLFHVFEQLIGCAATVVTKTTTTTATATATRDEIHNNNAIFVAAGTYNIRNDVKAHCMLRIFLQFFPHDSTIPWKAAFSAIKSLQFSTTTLNNTTATRHDDEKSSSTLLSRGDELAMISEIRYYITHTLRAVHHHTTNNSIEDNQKNIMNSSIPPPIVVQRRQQLVNMGHFILAPLLRTCTTTDHNRIVMMSTDDDDAGIDSKPKKLRRISYILPLDLIPAILSSMDVSDDVWALHSLEDDRVPFSTDNDDDISTTEINGNIDYEGIAQGRLRRDEFLSSMFATFSCNHIKNDFVRTARADTVLTLLSLAIDDIGFGKMSKTLSIDHRTTYWDCVKFALNDVIYANLVCHGSVDQVLHDSTIASNQQIIINESKHDEGIHVIPISDYPALMRCVFRMIDISALSAHESLGISWEFLFLRLYHAAAVATKQAPMNSAREKSSSNMDRLSLLSTIQTHIMLPSFTSASSSTITSILEACSRNCCMHCAQNIPNEYVSPTSVNPSVIPSWAVTGVVLIIMKARSSDTFYSSSSATFGPLIVSHMASNLIRKRSKESSVERPLSGRKDDVGQALTVLLRLSAVRDYTCHDCKGDKNSVGAEKQAYIALKNVYYGCNDMFFWRYPSDKNVDCPYQLELGLRTLSSISKLVRSSLHHGALDDGNKNQSSKESFLANSAKTWVDAATMLLDESMCSSTRQVDKTGIYGRTAFATIIVVVIFFEVPASQDAIIRLIYDRMVNTALQVCDNVEKRGDQSTFVLVSILAWSLAFADGKHSYNDTLLPKGDKHQNRATGILDPFCNLLSKVALSRDNNADTPRLSYGALRMLARAVLPVSSGREVILAIAQKKLGGLSVSSTSMYNHDDVYFAIDCLCALVEIWHPSNYGLIDDCSRAALGMLSDFIILNRWQPITPSHIPIEFVLWTMRKLNNLARSFKLSSWISQRFLRVCYLGLLRYISLQVSEVESDLAWFATETIFLKIYPPIIPNAGEYLSRLVQLAVSLYDANGSHDSVPDVSALLIHTTMQIQLSGKSSASHATLENVVNENDLDQHLRKSRAMLLKGFDSYDASKARDVDFVFLSILLQATARIVLVNISSPSKKVDYLESNLIKRMVKYVFDAEKFHHREGHHVYQNGSTFPEWIQTSFSCIDDSNQCTRPGAYKGDECFDFVEFKNFQSSLCDILVEILLRSRGQTMNDNSTEHERTTFAAVNTMSGYKRRVISFNVNVWNGLEHSSLCSLLELLAQFSHLLLRTNRKKNEIVLELETHVLGILDVCKIDPLRMNEHTRQSRIIKAFSSFYGSICDEESSRLLISFVKESYVEIGKWADSADTKFSLLSITSSEDLDEHVRYLRETILSSLSLLLSTVTSNPNVSCVDDRKVSLDVLSHLLLQLCQDLDASFQGYSGGIHKKLFLVFLNTIDNCINAITALFDSVPATVQGQKKECFKSIHQASTIIWEMFNENAFRQVKVIKATLRFCIDKTPNILTRVERTVQECIVSSNPIGLTCALLDKCCDQIFHHSSKRYGDASERNVQDEVRGSSVPSFPASATLAWVYTCAFVSLTNIWSESYRLISSVKSKRKVTGVKRSISLARRRISGISRMLTSAYRLFDEVRENTEEFADNADNYSTNMLVELLSYQGKISMCNLAEKITNTIMLALRQINKYLRESCIDSAPLDDNRLHESLICLLGWLNSVEITTELNHTMITGFLQWQANEKGKFNHVSFEKKDVYSIVGRLPKVILRLEGLVADVRKIVILLSTKNDPCVTKKLQALNHEVSVIHTKGEDADEHIKFQDMLSSCIKKIDDKKKTLQFDEFHAILNDEDEDSDVQVNEDDPLSSAKVHKRQLFGKVRKSPRVSLRSRNDTIDNWLTMDDDEFATAPGEKYNVDDAFVDLEDFIVEG